jgi:hypothetical protein
MGDGIAKYLARGLQGPLGQIIAPRPAMALSMATSSGAWISATGRAPICGKTSASKRRMTWPACCSLRAGFQCAHHFRATDSNEFSAAARLATLSAFLTTMGSLPAASTLRALSRPSRAWASDTSGYAPSAMTFSLPRNRYFQRHSFEPAGLTSRYKPLPSLSLTGLAPGLAFLMAVSVSGMAGSRIQLSGDTPNRIPPCPQRYPQQASACNTPRWTLKNKKAPWDGALRDVSRTVLDSQKRIIGGESGIRTHGTLRYA